MTRRSRIMCDELARLRRWKSEALEVLAMWETTWEAAGRPGRLGESRAMATTREIERLRFENAAWRDGVADVVEPLGFDREAACGPADLLPGLSTLAEMASKAPAPDQPAVEVSVRSTGRGTHDVILHGSPPAVLATVMFRDGVHGWKNALDRLAAELAAVPQPEVQP